jgi:septal ring factor EnvC (AmiA/AmiB activator)
MRIIALILGLAAVGAAALAWHEHQALAETRAEVVSANGQQQKARAELQALQTELAALRKEAMATKLAMEQMQADLASARSFLEAEKAVGTRLRDDLAKAKAQPRFAAPTAVTSRPTTVRAGPAGSAVGAGAPAR